MDAQNGITYPVMWVIHARQEYVIGCHVQTIVLCMGQHYAQILSIIRCAIGMEGAINGLLLLLAGKGWLA